MNKKFEEWVFKDKNHGTNLTYVPATGRITIKTK